MRVDDTIITGVSRYWMVHNASKGWAGVPNFRHMTREAAEGEARRLSMANRGAPFVVLEAVDAYYMPPHAPHRLPLLDPELPF